MTDALTLSETPIAAKVARLLLVSDLLHNTTARVRNASTYRGLLESSLPDIFESMQVCAQVHRHSGSFIFGTQLSAACKTLLGLALNLSKP